MATRLENILVRVRDTLADPLKERWTDASLVRLADEAQKIIAGTLRNLKTKTPVQLVANFSEYASPAVIAPQVSVLDANGALIPIATPAATATIPLNIQDITRVLNQYDQPIPVKTHEQMDKEYGINWELQTGDPVRVLVFDKLVQGKIKVYPIPLLTTTLPKTAITLYVTEEPTLVTLPTDLLTLPPMFDTMIKFYVTGMALRNDTDAQDTAVSDAELRFFASELKRLANEVSLSFVQHGEQFVTPYVAGI